MCGVWEAFAIKPRHVNVLPHLLWGVWRWRNDTTQFASGDKELGLVWELCGKQLNWYEDQLNRFLALHALVEGLGMCWAMFGLKVPILLNWVRLRPGIWDGGAISSTGWGAVCDRAPTRGCLGLALIRGSKQCGMDILPIFQLRLGSSLLIWMDSLASLVIWEGSLSIMLNYGWSLLHLQNQTLCGSMTTNRSLWYLRPMVILTKCVISIFLVQ